MAEQSCQDFNQSTYSLNQESKYNDGEQEDDSDSIDDGVDAEDLYGEETLQPQINQSAQSAHSSRGAAQNDR